MKCRYCNTPFTNGVVRDNKVFCSDNCHLMYIDVKSDKYPYLPKYVVMGEGSQETELELVVIGDSTNVVPYYKRVEGAWEIEWRISQGKLVTGRFLYCDTDGYEMNQPLREITKKEYYDRHGWKYREDEEIDESGNLEFPF